MRRKNFLHCAAFRAGAVIATALLGLAGQTSAVPAHAAAAGSCQPVRAYVAGLSEHRVQSGGRKRSFSLYVPRSYSGDRAVPIVFDLHALGVAPAIELKVTGMDKAAEEKGFVVALPAAVTPFPRGGTTWNIPYGGTGVDDVAFIKDVLETAKGLLCIDATRVYATGFSGGARL
jgi:polyhydroxybutyrate depolymerase